MARVLGVSKAGFYAWQQRPPSARAQGDAVLLQRIRTIHATSRQTYGARRAHAELRAQGSRHGCKRIARLMREAGLAGASRRRANHHPPRAREPPDRRPGAARLPGRWPEPGLPEAPDLERMER
jgi:putative transposase